MKNCIYRTNRCRYLNFLMCVSYQMWELHSEMLNGDIAQSLIFVRVTLLPERVPPPSLSTQVWFRAVQQWNWWWKQECEEWGEQKALHIFLHLCTPGICSSVKLKSAKNMVFCSSVMLVEQRHGFDLWDDVWTVEKICPYPALPKVLSAKLTLLSESKVIIMQQYIPWQCFIFVNGIFGLILLLH